MSDGMTLTMPLLSSWTKYRYWFSLMGGINYGSFGCFAFDGDINFRITFIGCWAVLAIFEICTGVENKVFVKWKIELWTGGEICVKFVVGRVNNLFAGGGGGGVKQHTV